MAAARRQKADFCFGLKFVTFYFRMLTDAHITAVPNDKWKIAKPSAFCLLPSAFCLLPSAFCLLPSAFCLLPSAFCLLPSAFCLLPSDF